MTLYKTTLWTGISTFFKAVLMYLMWKIIAVYTGPSGIALVEQFQNFLQLSRTSAVCGINQAVVKYVAEYKDNENKKSSILSNAIILNFISCLVVSIFLIGFSTRISHIILLTDSYSHLIKLIAVSTILFALNNLGISILNGELEIKKYTACIIANTILNFFITVYLVIYFDMYGALIAFILNQSLVSVVTVYFVVKSKWFKFQLFFQGMNFESAYKLIKYSLMIFTTTFIIPISLITIRRYIAHSLSWQETGYWQGMMRLSSGYIIIMNMIFSIYYLPKLSSACNMNELKIEVIRSYKIIFPFILLGLMIVFILKKQIVILMYSKEFLPMTNLFKYQLMGDIARIGTWLLSNILLAKAMVKTFVFFEIFFSVTYILFTMMFVHYLGLIGGAIGFTVNYTLYWIAMIIFTIWYLNRKRGQI